MAIARDSAPLLTPAFLRRLERLALATRRVQRGAGKGERRSKRKGSSVEFADYRDYVQGDDLRHIDWNLYARLGQLYLKLFEETEDLTLHILVDASRSMAFGTPTKMDFARRLAAAIAYIGLAGYDRVAISAFSAGGTRVLSPVRGKANVQKLFAFLEGIEAGGGTTLDGGARDHLLRTRTRGVTLLLTDALDPEGYEGAIKRLAAARADLHVVQVLAPEELDPRLSGDLKLVDSETGAAVEISVTPALLRRYAKNRDAFVTGLRDFCRARGVGHYLVSSATPLEELTLEVLRHGGLLR
jgi:uncharacterized protein (DUF58 family)